MDDILKIDEKFSIKYDPNQNDRPLYIMRYEEKSAHSNHILSFNAVTAMFYRLLELEKLLEEANAKIQNQGS